MRDEELKRFLAKVEKVDGHWLWTGATNENGYGVFGIDGTLQKAHRVAYEHFVGPLNGLHCLHKNECHTPNCVNPEHLYPGDQEDNINDRVKMFGAINLNPARGSKHYNAKLNEEQVARIKRMLLNGRKSEFIAREFGVATRTISEIKIGGSWKHVQPCPQ